MKNDRLKAQWFVYLRQKNLKETTIANYRKHLKSFDRWLEGRLYVDMVLVDFQDFFKSRRIATSTRNALTATLMSFYGFLYERNHMIRDVRECMPKFDNSRKLLENVPTVPEVRKLILTPDMDTPQGYRDRAMIITQYSGGLRCAELLGMNIDDIDSIRQTITVTRKGGAIQTVPVGELAMTYLLIYIDQIRPQLTQSAGQWLWCNDAGRRSTELNYRPRVKKYWREQGIEKYSTHSLRHGAGTHMMKNGAPLHAISAFLGHKDLGMVERYTKVEAIEVRGAVDCMDFD